MNKKMFFQHPFSMLITGPSGSGKTQFVIKLLENRFRMIQNAPSSVFWHYGAWQDQFAGLPYNFVEGCPKADSYHETIVVVDDLMCEAQLPVSNLFTKFVHHNRITCIFLTQNLFPRSPFSRNISLNCNYIVLMKNTRDKAQVMHLARQVFPGNSKLLVDVYADATQSPYSYLLIDFVPTTSDNERMKTGIFPTDSLTVYAARKV